MCSYDLKLYDRSRFWQQTMDWCKFDKFTRNKTEIKLIRIDSTRLRSYSAIVGEQRTLAEINRHDESESPLLRLARSYQSLRYIYCRADAHRSTINGSNSRTKCWSTYLTNDNALERFALSSTNLETRLTPRLRKIRPNS